MELIRKRDAIRAVLHNQGDAAVAAVQMIPSAWIKCSERLPEKSKNVLAANNRGKQWDIDKAWYNGLYFDRCGKKPLFHVTHWMPLPDAPEVEE